MFKPSPPKKKGIYIISDQIAINIFAIIISYWLMLAKDISCSDSTLNCSNGDIIICFIFYKGNCTNVK